jgi:HNH/Endo VII superfamily nuclease toxin with a HHH motif
MTDIFNQNLASSRIAQDIFNQNLANQNLMSTNLAGQIFNQNLANQNLVSSNIAQDIFNQNLANQNLVSSNIAQDIFNQNLAMSRLVENNLAQENYSRQVAAAGQGGQYDPTRDQQQKQQLDDLQHGEELARQQLVSRQVNEEIRIAGLVSGYNPNYQGSPFDPPTKNRPQEEQDRWNQQYQQEQEGLRRHEEAVIRSMERQQDAVTELYGQKEFIPGERDFMPPEHWIDMRDAPESSARTSASSGSHKRNSRWFWEQMLYLHPEFFSEKNRTYIEAGKSPMVDEQWLEFHRAQEIFEGDLLVHHHVDRGPMAAGIPEELHRIFHGPLHYE